MNTKYGKPSGAPAAADPADSRSTWRDALAAPQAVALIGVSDHPGKMTGGPLRFLRKHGYGGRVYPVNPRHASVQGERSYPDIRAIPDRIDHAYILVNTDDALASVDACARAGVRVATLLAGGFAEAGPAGRRKQEALLATAHAGGMRLVGPNSLGVMNLHNGFTLTATPALNAEKLLPGRLFVLSQSGGMMGTLISRGFARGIGFSKAMSVGNEADLTVGEIGDAFVDDPQTSAFLLFLETVRDAPAMARFARRAAAAGKPVIAYKLGRSSAGSEMAVSHTGAMIGSDRAVDAFLKHHGIVRVDHLETLFELPALLIGRRPPQAASPAVGVVTTTGGGAALIVDRLGMLGVETRAPAPPTYARLAAQGLALAQGRVLDLTMAGTRADAIRTALDVAGSAPEFDLALAVVGNSAEFNTDLTVRPIAESAGGGGKPVVAFLGPNAETALRMLADAGIPAFRTPESCADAIHAYLTWRSPAPAVRTAAELAHQAGLALAQAAADGVNENSAMRVFAALGVPTVPGAVMAPGSRAPAGLRYPVAAKVLSADIAHKTQAGGVALGLASPAELEKAAQRLHDAVLSVHPDALIDGILVQPMESGLAEVLLGYRVDDQVGPLVTLAAGGILAEIYDDSAVRVAPVDEAAALRMIEEVKGLAPIRGYRGLPAGDLPALARAIAAFSQLAALPQVREAEINPLIVRPAGRGVVGVDALLSVHPAPATPAGPAGAATHRT